MLLKELYGKMLPQVAGKEKKPEVITDKLFFGGKRYRVSKVCKVQFMELEGEVQISYTDNDGKEKTRTEFVQIKLEKNPTGDLGIARRNNALMERYSNNYYYLRFEELDAKRPERVLWSHDYMISPNHSDVPKVWGKLFPYFGDLYRDHLENVLNDLGYPNYKAFADREATTLVSKVRYERLAPNSRSSFFAVVTNRNISI